MAMKQSVLLMLLSFLSLHLEAGNKEVPVSNFRAPAYPLITIDPYISAWSHTDKLYDDDIRHWTGTEHPLVGVLRVDGKCYRFMGKEIQDRDTVKNDACFSEEAVQIKVQVLPTQTYYSFYCGPVQLNLKFTSPLVLDNLDLLSIPVNYISYDVHSLDRHAHDVQIYFSATPKWAVNTIDQEVSVERYNNSDLAILKTGTLEQGVLGKSGDLICIDWGYFYLAGKLSDHSALSMGSVEMMKKVFAEDGKLPEVDNNNRKSVQLDQEEMLLAYTENLGRVKDKPTGGHLLIGYDDIESVQYFGENLKAYWKKKHATMEAALADAEKNYTRTMEKCNVWDRKVMRDAVNAGGQQYAELCAASYRQAIAAHKLVLGPKGELFFFSKENNSNGSIGTVDISYPSSPLFIRYNTEVMKAMLNFIFDYSESGRWTKPFAAHDVGTYPLANGQTYQGDMPVEETGNMLIMTTAIAFVDKNADYAAKHWNILTQWADYLVEEGMDPENQLCTEDFAGHLAHNANLSAKAIMGIAGYGRLAEMLNKPEAQKYIGIAKNMAVEWEKKANDGDHYRLTFDKSGTWSQKYNFVWDRTLGLNILPEEICRKEVAYYLKKQNKYGLPLDNRFTWGKVDDTVWSATMANSESDFLALIMPLWRYLNETSSRVPLGDWYETLNADYINFRARSVVGGVFMKSLDYYLNGKKKY